MEMSNYFRDAIANTLRGTSFTAPTTVYAALYLSDPTVADVGTEVSLGGYARLAISLAAPSPPGAMASDAVLEWTASGGNFGLLTHIGLRDALSGGNLLLFSPLDASETINDGQTYRIPIGNLTVAFT